MSEYARYNVVRTAWRLLSCASAAVPIGYWPGSKWLVGACLITMAISSSEATRADEEWRYRHIRRYLENPNRYSTFEMKQIATPKESVVSLVRGVGFWFVIFGVMLALGCVIGWYARVLLEKIG